VPVSAPVGRSLERSALPSSAEDGRSSAKRCGTPGSVVPTAWFLAAPRISSPARTFSRNAPSAEVTRARPTCSVTSSTTPPAAWIAAAAAAGLPAKETTYSALPDAGASSSAAPVEVVATTAVIATARTPSALTGRRTSERRERMRRPFPAMPWNGFRVAWSQPRVHGQ
jgi:hypothetical protein